MKKYGQIAGSKKISDAIYSCFQFLNEREAEKFVRQFKKQPHDEGQVMHTFRELILGAYLAKYDFQMCHDYEIDSKTPDWSILDENSQPQGIFELLNFHPDAETSTDIIRQIEEKKDVWGYVVKPNTDRLYHKILEKASKYKPIVLKHNLPYVIAVFGEFTAVVKEYEINESLSGEIGLFEMYPELSGLLYFEESAGSYLFSYKPNPHANIAMEISSDWFHLKVVGPNPRSTRQPGADL